MHADRSERGVEPLETSLSYTLYVLVCYSTSFRSRFVHLEANAWAKSRTGAYFGRCKCAVDGNMAGALRVFLGMEIRVPCPASSPKLRSERCSPASVAISRGGLPCLRRCRGAKRELYLSNLKPVLMTDHGVASNQNCVLGYTCGIWLEPLHTVGVVYIL